MAFLKVTWAGHDIFQQRATYDCMELSISTLWCQLEDMFQLIVTPQGIEKVTIKLEDTPTKVYAIGARLFYQRYP